MIDQNEIFKGMFLIVSSIFCILIILFNIIKQNAFKFIIIKYLFNNIIFLLEFCLFILGDAKNFSKPKQG